MKYEYYKQFPIPPNTGIGSSGTDSFIISPSVIAGYISRVKAVYLDIPSGVTLDVDIAADQDKIHSNGNEAGSVVFRSGAVFTRDIAITISGPVGTAYRVGIITEIDDKVTEAVPGGTSSLVWLALLGIGAGALYLATRKKQKSEYK